MRRIASCLAFFLLSPLAAVSAETPTETPTETPAETSAEKPAVSVKAPAETPARRKIAVMDLKPDTAIDGGTLKTLNEILLNEFSKSAQLDVLGSSDIASMLTLEEERIKLTGCADDSCLAEIGGALGVELVGDSRVGAVGDTYVINVKVLDVKNASVLGRSSETTARNQGDLIAAIQRAVDIVVAKVEGREPRIPAPVAAATADGTLTATATAEEPAGFLDYGPWVFLGVTAATGITGAILGGLAYSDDQAAQDEYAGTPDWRDARDGMESKALAADVLFGIAGAAAVATVVLFVLGALDDDEPAATATVAPVRGGGVAGVSVRFR